MPQRSLRKQKLLCITLLTVSFASSAALATASLKTILKDVEAEAVFGIATLIKDKLSILSNRFPMYAYESEIGIKLNFYIYTMERHVTDNGIQTICLGTRTENQKTLDQYDSLLLCISFIADKKSDLSGLKKLKTEIARASQKDPNIEGRTIFVEMAQTSKNDCFDMKMESTITDAKSEYYRCSPLRKQEEEEPLIRRISPRPQNHPTQG